MKKTGATRIHFVLLAMGTVLYLIRYPGMTTEGDGIVEANMGDIGTFCVNTMFYIAFVVLLFGHALLWYSPSVSSEPRRGEGGSARQGDGDDAEG